MKFKEDWNKIHEKFFSCEIKYDDWLDKYKNLLESCKSSILDLGCGTGNDTLYLVERGFKVISCDYSEVALEKIKKFIPKAETCLLDISKKLPFKNESFDIIIADLSLHYFDDKTTKSIMGEIKRVLKPDGHLIARVNSVEDINHGAGQGIKLEKNFYFVEGYNKRFFDDTDIIKYFSIIGEVNLLHSVMLRYSTPKKTIEVVIKKTH